MDMLSSSSSSSLGSSPSTISYSRPITQAAVQPPYRPFSASANSSTAPTGPRFPRRIRSMSNDEYRKHLAAGTCFKCVLKYGPTHKCPPKTINVLVGDVEDDSIEDFHDAVEDGNNDSDQVIQPSPTHFELSALFSNGLDSYRTMKLLGYISSSPVHVMVDSDASHCFVAEHVAHRLQLPIIPTTAFSVVLGDVSKVKAAGLCSKVSISLNSEVFFIDCYVFPLNSIDIILGISWLATLGDVKANWRNLSMEFTYNDHIVHHHGDPFLTRRACSFSELHNLDAGDCCWVLLSLETATSKAEFGMDESLSEAARHLGSDRVVSRFAI